MSGLEILGIAASVVSIAELGAKLSVKLFTFSRKVKNADKSIDSISKQIAFTGSVLQQLGVVLNEHDNAKLCKPEYTASARSLVDACEKIFSELNDALDGGGRSNSGSANIVLGMRQRLKFPFLQPQIDLLQAKLESLQSSLQVMLQALVLAVGLKNHEAVPLLREQKATLKSLVEEQALMAQRLTQLTVQNTESKVAPIHVPPTSSRNVTFVQSEAQPSDRDVDQVSAWVIQHLPMHLHDRAEEIFDHSRMLTALMNEIDNARYKVNTRIRSQTRDGLLALHYTEWANHLRGYTNSRQWPAIFTDYPQLQRFWERMCLTDSTRIDSRQMFPDLWEPPDVTSRPVRSHSGLRPSGRPGQSTVAVPLEQDSELFSDYTSRSDQSLSSNIRHRDEYGQDSSSGASTPVYGMSIETADLEDACQRLSPAPDERSGSSSGPSPTGATTSYLSSYMNAQGPRAYAPSTRPLRKSLARDKEEDDPNYEDSSHVSNVLRAYYTEKGRAFPQWLPPDPRIAASVDKTRRARYHAEPRYNPDLLPTHSEPSTGREDDITVNSAREQLREGLQLHEFGHALGFVHEFGDLSGSHPVDESADDITTLLQSWTALDEQDLHLLSTNEIQSPRKDFQVHAA